MTNPMPREIRPVLNNEVFSGVDRGELGVVLTMTSGSATLQRKGLNNAWVDVAEASTTVGAQDLTVKYSQLSFERVL